MLIILLFYAHTDIPARARISIFLNAGKGQEKHRVCALQLPVCLMLPYRKTLKQICPVPIADRKKLLQHTHVQRLPETPWARDQRHIIPAFPPLPYKIRLINIKTTVFPDFFKILIANAYRSRHNPTSLSINNFTTTIRSASHPTSAPYPPQAPAVSGSDPDSAPHGKSDNKYLPADNP